MDSPTADSVPPGIDRGGCHRTLNFTMLSYPDDIKPNFLNMRKHICMKDIIVNRFFLGHDLDSGSPVIGEYGFAETDMRWKYIKMTGHWEKGSETRRAARSGLIPEKHLQTALSGSVAKKAG
jgi:hypothetical protein